MRPRLRTFLPVAIAISAACSSSAKDPGLGNENEGSSSGTSSDAAGGSNSGGNSGGNSQTSSGTSGGQFQWELHHVCFRFEQRFDHRQLEFVRRGLRHSLELVFVRIELQGIKPRCLELQWIERHPRLHGYPPERRHADLFVHNWRRGQPRLATLVESNQQWMLYRIHYHLRGQSCIQRGLG